MHAVMHTVQRQREKLVFGPDAAPASGFQPVMPRPAPLSTLPKDASLAANLRAALAGRAAGPFSEAAAMRGGGQRWCLARDWYTQDDDNAGWF